MSERIYFERVSLRNGTQVFSTKFTTAESLSEPQGWTIWCDPGSLWVYAQYRNGEVTMVPVTAIAGTRVKKDAPKVEEPEGPSPGELEAIAEHEAAKAAEKPAAKKTKLPPRRAAAPVAEPVET